MYSGRQKYCNFEGAYEFSQSMVGSENSVLWSHDSLLFLRSLACRYYTLVIICMEKNIMKNNLEHIVRGNMLDGHKRDISAWALRKLQYFWQPSKMGLM